MLKLPQLSRWPAIAAAAVGALLIGLSATSAMAGEFKFFQSFRDLNCNGPDCEAIVLKTASNERAIVHSVVCHAKSTDFAEAFEAYLTYPGRKTVVYFDLILDRRSPDYFAGGQTSVLGREGPFLVAQGKTVKAVIRAPGLLIDEAHCLVSGEKGTGAFPL